MHAMMMRQYFNMRRGGTAYNPDEVAKKTKEDETKGEVEDVQEPKQEDKLSNTEVAAQTPISEEVTKE